MLNQREILHGTGNSASFLWLATDLSRLEIWTTESNTCESGCNEGEGRAHSGDPSWDPEASPVRQGRTTIQIQWVLLNIGSNNLTYSFLAFILFIYFSCLISIVKTLILY